MPVVFLFARMDGMLTLLGDCDTGWHIRTGEWILAHHAVPARDIFSFSKPGEVWYAWEWLSEIIFAWLYRHGGLATLALFAILLLAFTFTLVFRLVRGQSNALVAVIVTMLAAAGSSIHWLARPHLFTLLFLVPFLARSNVCAPGRRTWARCRSFPSCRQRRFSGPTCMAASLWASCWWLPTAWANC
jgi:hypothetical protein